MLAQLRIAVHSALAASLCLGIPAGLLFWLVLFHGTTAPSVTMLTAHALNKIFVLMICSFGWSYLLGRIAHYRAWLKIGFATALGILAGWYSPLANLDGWFADKLPVAALYALTLCGMVASVTLCVGLAYGWLLRSLRAALVLALSTSSSATLTTFLAITLCSHFGLFVGGAVPFAMSRVTALSLLLAALSGGAMLGVGFSRFGGDAKRGFPVNA